MSPWLIVTAVGPTTVRATVWMVAVACRETARVALYGGAPAVVAGSTTWLRRRSRERSRHASTS